MEKTRAIVIADAGSIIHLDELNSLDLLVDFDKVIIPETVWNEVEQHRPQALACSEVKFIRQCAVHFSAQVDALTPFYTLHAGEQEALHLCFEFTNSLLLTDDTAAARLAAKKSRRNGTWHTGCVGSRYSPSNPLKIGRIGIVIRYSNTDHFTYSRFFIGRSH